MKTIRKGIVGILFLMPLLLPFTTKAGGLDDWFRGFFHSNANRPVVRPDDNGFRRYDPYRPYDPYNNPSGRGRQNPAGPQSGQDGNAVPIDGGLIFLLAAGLAFGAKKMYDLKKGLAVADLG
jgi:hypothetical protein